MPFQKGNKLGPKVRPHGSKKKATDLDIEDSENILQR
jgi:hypothetical protein